jgi:hypothetical protein
MVKLSMLGLRGWEVLIFKNFLYRGIQRYRVNIFCDFFLKYMDNLCRLWQWRTEGGAGSADASGLGVTGKGTFKILKNYCAGARVKIINVYGICFSVIFF